MLNHVVDAVFEWDFGGGRCLIPGTQAESGSSTLSDSFKRRIRRDEVKRCGSRRESREGEGYDERGYVAGSPCSVYWSCPQWWHTGLWPHC